MKYETRPDGRIIGVVEHEGIPIMFAAKDIRKERNSIKALIYIRIAGETVARDEMHPDKDAERVRLVNSAHGQLGTETQRLLGKAAIKKCLDNFTDGLWEQHLGKIVAKPMKGTRMKEKPYLMRPYLLKNAGVIMFAPPGATKSWTGLGVALTVDFGLADSPYGEPTGRYRTLYINLERSDESLDNRIADVKEQLGLAEEWEMLTLSERGKTLADVQERVRDIVIKEGVEFIVLDSVSRSGMGDLRSDQDMNRIMDTLNSFGVAWLALAHTPRADNTHAFGSIMGDAAADLTLGLFYVREAATGKVVTVIRGDKANDMPIPRDRYLAYEFAADHLTAIRPTTAQEYIALEAQQAKAKDDDTAGKIAAYIKANGPSSASQLAAIGISRQAVSKHLERRQDLFVLDSETPEGKFFGLRVQPVAQPVAQGEAQPGNPRRGFHPGVAPPHPASEEITCSRCKRTAGDNFRYDPTGEPMCISCAALEENRW